MKMVIYCVSIPHRFNSHLFCHSSSGFKSGVSIPHRFNSHQSGLLKEIKTKMVSIPHRFNSHPHREVPRLQNTQVSIPHRFNSHKSSAVKIACSRSSFNPSQVQFTPMEMHSCFEPIDRFQSLTGSIHTLMKKWNIK